MIIKFVNECFFDIGDIRTDRFDQMSEFNHFLYQGLVDSPSWRRSLKLNSLS